MPVGSLWLGALRAIFENSEYSDLGPQGQGLGFDEGLWGAPRRPHGEDLAESPYLVTQFLGYEQALIRGACTVLSATRSESALRTDFESLINSYIQTSLHRVTC